MRFIISKMFMETETSKQADSSVVYSLKISLTHFQPMYPLKTLENHRLFDVFGGYRSGTLVESGLIS